MDKPEILALIEEAVLLHKCIINLPADMAQRYYFVPSYNWILEGRKLYHE